MGALVVIVIVVVVVVIVVIESLIVLNLPFKTIQVRHKPIFFYDQKKNN